MSTLIVPSPADAQAAIMDHLNTLHLGPVTDARRKQIINNCLGPIVLLIEAVQLASAAGPEEEAVFIDFIRTLHAQSELVRREYYFSNLLAKLTEMRQK